ncbi:hypothetical protein F5Y16DRAFT_228673 [Xylariaceae sp. FL0255]|nr:hypothetical protein F5Y16DRAFT_228673 [Xylariaceae sp. FL0255]
MRVCFFAVHFFFICLFFFFFFCLIVSPILQKHIGNGVAIAREAPASLWSTLSLSSSSLACSRRTRGNFVSPRPSADESSLGGVSLVVCLLREKKNCKASKASAFKKQKRQRGLSIWFVRGSRCFTFFFCFFPFLIVPTVWYSQPF